jgi:hypothetical protein
VGLLIAAVKHLPSLRLLHLEADTLDAGALLMFKQITPPGPLFVLSLKSATHALLGMLKSDFPKLSFTTELPFVLPDVFAGLEKRVRWQ